MDGYTTRSLSRQKQLSRSTLYCRPPSSSPSWTKQLSCSTLYWRPPSSSPSWTKQLSCSTPYCRPPSERRKLRQRPPSCSAPFCRRHLNLRTLANWTCIQASASATRVPTQSLHHAVCGLLSQGVQSPSSAVLHLKTTESLGRHVIIPATVRHTRPFGKIAVCAKPPTINTTVEPDAHSLRPVS